MTEVAFAPFAPSPASFNQIRIANLEEETPQTSPPQDECPEPDHPLCDLYFDDYFHKVMEWSNDNGYSTESHIPKACGLIRDLQGGLVTRACCKSFKERCPEIEEFLS